MMYTLLTFAVVVTAIVAATRRDTHRPWRPYAVLCVLFLSLAAVVALCGCPLPKPDDCTPMATRCSPEGRPQRCSTAQRWWSEPASQPCAATGYVCCLARSPYNNLVHSCVPQSACLPEVTDAAVAVDAALEGGAQ